MLISISNELIISPSLSFFSSVFGAKPLLSLSYDTYDSERIPQSQKNILRFWKDSTE